MFILSSGNYRKCSAHVSCIIVFAVEIGRAGVKCEEGEVLEALMFQRGKTVVWAMKAFNCFSRELPSSLLKEILVFSEHP